jgi:hypothetical protein
VVEELLEPDVHELEKSRLFLRLQHLLLLLLLREMLEVRATRVHYPVADPSHTHTHIDTHTHTHIDQRECVMRSLRATHTDTDTDTDTDTHEAKLSLSRRNGMV